MPISVQKNLVYKKEPTSLEDQALDLYLPSDLNDRPQLPPLLVFVHGGLWLDRDKANYENIGTFFAERGLSVAVVNYRKSKRGVVEGESVHPVHVLDFVECLKYLYANANKNYDTNNIFLFGHSCGAHIISLPFLARSKYLNKETFAPKGIIGLQGLYDVDLFVKGAPEWAADIEFAFSKDRTNWESPQNASDFGGHKEIAWLVIHSPEDTAVNINQAQNMNKHLKEIGFPEVELAGNITGGHDDGVSKIGTIYDVASPLILNFIWKHYK
eukprot:Phypoly_transcript_16770.p1 GENE.Phypoly_transcript_16770~~Phypoly_transcript_16770.p1  ORF type:complete len:270 (+),score=50.93 Phypoly_transcript_16770:31-840(+)